MARYSKKEDVEVAKVAGKPTETGLTAKKELPPLEAHLKYFEAPDGELIVGEADKSHVWYRKGNNGNGCWINPKR